MIGRPPKPVLERLLARVSVTSNGCWKFDGARDYLGGYGQISIGSVAGKPVRKYAHRVAYECLVGGVPEGLSLDHLCRNRACVNPDHLEAVTPQENTLRSLSPAAVNARKTRCPQGHPYTAENTGRTGRRRWCRTCKRDKAHARRQRAKQKEIAP